MIQAMADSMKSLITGVERMKWQNEGVYMCSTRAISVISDVVCVSLTIYNCMCMIQTLTASVKELCMCAIQTFAGDI